MNVLTVNAGSSYWSAVTAGLQVYTAGPRLESF